VPRRPRLLIAPGLCVVVGLASSLIVRSSRAHENEPGEAESPEAPLTFTVVGEKGISAASADEIRQRDLALRPRIRPGDILEVVPGLFAVQHAGGGKANQYFLRGFDADHGTDIAFFVDGVPVNLPSHGHGQGFADLHFVIPELVSTLSAVKGPYYARFGDFATAGAVDLKYYDHLHESSATFEVGQYGIFRALFMVAPELGEDWSTLVAGEAYADEGPFTHGEHLKRFNGVGRVTRHMGPSALTLTFMTYGSGWNASGQVPLRALGTPELPTELDALDPTEGGSTQRHQLSVGYTYRKDDDEARALVYAIRYRFTLFSNFTLYAKDPVYGDEIEQDDERTVLGTHWYYKRKKLLGPFLTTTTLGIQARSDTIENGLHHAFRRKLLGSVVEAGVNETSIGLYGEEDFRIARWLRVVFGLRLDRFDIAVKDHLEAQEPTGASTSGVAGSTLASPKMSAILTPLTDWDVYLNFGRGFHSNDARGATRRLDPSNPTVTLLTKGTGYELGTRVRLWNQLDVAAALFRLDLDSETIWSGDAGTTEAVGPTRRTGVELEARFRLWEWLFLDGDATFTRAVFRENAGNGNAVALAPTRTLAAGVSVRHPLGFFGAIRMRSIGSRPANDGADRIAKPLDAEGWTLFDAMAGYRYKNLELAADVRNLFNTKWREVQFANTSRLKSEVDAGSPAQQDLHFTPGWPFTALGRVTLYW
jgi:outer membrane receptor protein involved in Fe transport